MKRFLGIFLLLALIVGAFAWFSRSIGVSALIDLPSDVSQVEIQYFSCSEETAATLHQEEELAALLGWLDALKLTKRTFPEADAPNNQAGGEAYAFTFYDQDGPMAELAYFDGGTQHYISHGADWYEVKNPLLPAVLSAVFPAAPQSDLIPMVFVEGKLYLDTGKESDLDGRCGVMDGEITSSVRASEEPTENDQSNFGASYAYQFTDENSLDINIDGTWFRFAAEEETADGTQ